MNHEQREHFRENYLPAALYLQSQLGAGAGKYADELRRLSYSDDLDSLKKQVDRWAGSAPQTPSVSGGEPRPSFQPLPPPNPDRPWATGALWGKSTRVRNVGGIWWDLKCQCGAEFTSSTNDTVPDDRRLCQDCQDAASLQRAVTIVQNLATNATRVAGNAVRAQEMWTKHRRFVRKRLHAELGKHTGGKQYELFDDVEAKVWNNVFARIGGYEDQGLKHGAMAWLKSVVFSTVADHFDAQYAGVRDVRKEAALPDDDILVAPWEAMDARPTAATPLPDYDGDSFQEVRDAHSR